MSIVRTDPVPVAAPSYYRPLSFQREIVIVPSRNRYYSLEICWHYALAEVISSPGDHCAIPLQRQIVIATC